MKSKVELGQCIDSIKDKLTDLNMALVECQKKIDDLTVKIEQQKMAKELSLKQRLIKLPEVDCATWFKLSPEGRKRVKPLEIDLDEYFSLSREKQTEYNEARYAALMFESLEGAEKEFKSNLVEHKAEKKRLISESFMTTLFLKKLRQLNALIQKSTYLQDSQFEIQGFNLESLSVTNSASMTQMDVWINILTNYPNVTLEFFEVMQFSAFYTYKDICVEWLSGFKAPTDRRAALCIFDKLDTRFEASHLKVDEKSFFKPVYEAISAIEKHGKQEGLQYEIDLACALKRDLYRLENEPDPGAREQRKIVFLTRLHSMDDFMGEDRSNQVVRGLKILVENVALMFLKIWTVLFCASETSEFGAQPKMTNRQKRVQTVDNFFRSADVSKNKENGLNPSVARDDEASPQMIRESTPNKQ